MVASRVEQAGQSQYLAVAALGAPSHLNTATPRTRLRPAGRGLRPRWLTAAAPDPSASAPGARLISLVQNGSERTLLLRLIANGNDRVTLIAPEDAGIRSAGVDGFVRPIDQSESGKTLIDCFGRSCDGAVLQLTIGKASPVEMLVVGSKAGLPPSAAPLLAARPKFARPQYNRDETIAFARIRL